VLDLPISCDGYGRGERNLPYMPEPKISVHLGHIFKDIHVPENIAEAMLQQKEIFHALIGNSRRQFEDGSIAVGATRACGSIKNPGGISS
jgi:hypothetical protein